MCCCAARRPQVRDVEEANIKAHFSKAFERIEACREAGTAVFVHCSRGVSRSASLCIAYLMRKESISADAARERVHACRPIILPNEGFVRCLVEYGKELRGERTGVYAPAPKPSGGGGGGGGGGLDEMEVELPQLASEGAVIVDASLVTGFAEVEAPRGVEISGDFDAIDVMWPSD